ncbi:MAG: hypothetical protein K2F95_08080 [Alistipes sp.]|nr:hypothetical protein [Alistipes sp.]
MKISGRNIGRRLYGLGTLPSRLKRARYFRGHGVHSPYVYDIVRKVFMKSKLQTADTALYDKLRDMGISRRRAIQLQNLLAHCGYETFGIDCAHGRVDMLIASLDTAPDMLTRLAAAAEQSRSTLCIMSPYFSAERHRACQQIADAHPSTSVDNRGYLLLFNNHLPRQRFKL